MSAYTGKTPIMIGGKELTLVYDWDALGCIKSELGVDGQAKALAGDLKELAALVAIGLKAHHPETSKDSVWAASPSVYPTVEAVKDALIAAYYGPDSAPKEEDENPPKPPQTKLSWLCRRLSGRG